ncbi:MAG: hypothetical protein ACTSXJ_08100 [Candidatus Baldrarchaeia archaeon]
MKIKAVDLAGNEKMVSVVFNVVKPTIFKTPSSYLYIIITTAIIASVGAIVYVIRRRQRHKVLSPDKLQI